MKCKDTYKKHSLLEEWRKQGQDDIEHQFDLLLSDEDDIVYKICTNCGAKQYPDNY